MSSPEERDVPRPSKRSRTDTQTDDAYTVVVPVAAEPRRVELNPADCDLDFDISGNGLEGEAFHEGGFAYCWSGARATVGIRRGKYCFGCKIVSEQAVEMGDTPSAQQHLCRIGVSRGDDPVSRLGESDHSFGFGGTGKFSNQGKFADYGGRFGVGDTIVCAVDLECSPMSSIGFSRNGQWLGIANYFDAGAKGLGLVDTPVRCLQWESALFPHVLLKNVVVQMQFSREDGLEPVDGYVPWDSACAHRNAIFGPVLSEQRECEVVMMVGLPASGKSTWAEKLVKEQPHKRYILLGTNLALEQMKVPGLLRKHNYGERFDCLMDRATVIFNTWLARAAKIPRNYIIDQTNVYKNARIRKLKPFTNYRKTAVVMFPSPSELKLRAAKRFEEMGKEVPAEAINEMIANFVLPLSKNMPGSKEPFDEVLFVELSREDAQRNLDEMRRLLLRASTASCDNFNNQNITSTDTRTGALVDSRTMSSLSGFGPPMDYSYERYSGIGPCSAAPLARGVHPLGKMTHQQTPWSVQSFQSPKGSQHPIHSTYPNTPLPGYERGTYGSHGNPSPQNPNHHNAEMYQRMQVPMVGRNLNQTHELAEVYGGPVYEATNSVGRSNYTSYAPPPPVPMYSSQPSDPQMPYHDSFSSGGSNNYRSYGQHSHGVQNAGLQYSTPIPRSPFGAPPNYLHPRPSPWYN